jgi:hypothetical protein
LRAIHERYRRTTAEKKGRIVDAFCRMCGYHRKYAIRLVHGPQPPLHAAPGRRRGMSYSDQTIRILAEVWEAAGYPWSVRLKALLPDWLPWIRRRFRLTAATEAQLLRLRPRQIDRRLRAGKTAAGRRLSGRTSEGAHTHTRQHHTHTAGNKSNCLGDEPPGYLSNGATGAGAREAASPFEA